ncbi:Crp/Fnr family transcriptional regulator [Solitalea sp. MAHUQ-68]|uniref:Crp/Fnr family transcriptional regulator n=1 Tax=Solitalea agri TaxID=2953739 RepID=A0A9X2JBM8_9SPHI|nr:Crp/Fnr family transcriptional regulator [Solitalea agri]MCO4291624.1 Crp/Fnr family transcriptional regulator [Solitalea agri]
MSKKHADYFSCKDCQYRSHSVFCGLKENELTLIDSHKGHITFNKGEEIFVEGDRPHGIYCIHSGKIKLSKHGDSGKEQIVRFAKESDVLGYRALLGNEIYDCSAIALETVEICFIPKKDFFQIFDNSPSLSLNLVKLLSSDLRNAENKLTDIAQKPVRERIAENILLLKETFGEDEDSGCIKVILSREEIANLAGTATETAIRLLSELKNDELIQFVGKKIKILNSKELLKRANLYN